jgi:di/tricarboxylate transporter
MWRTGFVLNLIAIAVLCAVISLWVPAVYGR